MVYTSLTPRTAYFSPGLSVGLFLIRCILATVFIYHGAQILFGIWGGPGPKGFASMSHLPLWMGWAVGIAQLGGGLSMLTGLLMPLGALGIVVVMVGAIYLVHWQHGFNILHGGMEYALTEMIVAMGLGFTGPGAYSLAALSSGNQPRAGSTVAR